jgi:nitrite reductase/ring-hydroxylating ferredoxin subunit
MAWVKACRSEDISLEKITRQKLERGPVVALTRVAGDRIVAFETRCPHRNGPLSFGKISGTEITCPWHFFRFDLISGVATATDKSIMKLTTFPVKVDDGTVFVDLPEHGTEATSPDADQQRVL